MKVQKAFMKPSEAPQRSENKNLSYIIFILIQLSEMHEVGRVKMSSNANACVNQIPKLVDTLTVLL